MILDTSFVIDVLRNRKEAIEKSTQLDNSDEPIFITSISVFELWQIWNLLGEKKKRILAEFVDSFGMLSFDSENAQLAGEVQSELMKSGLQIDPEDCMIAGIALTSGQAILTRDKHYSRIKGLKVQSY
ncbi:MAG: PIN domain-containing protein [Nanoarchaeota archaeon]